ncbi:MAG: response regulator [Chloroflexota bacterium]|nr:response regulator [Chloroflexota bacterium]
MAAGRAPRILVVDDDPGFLELMRDLFAGTEGFEVITRKEWTGADELVRTLRPDVVVLDIMSGPSDPAGWYTLESLRGDPRTRNVPVIVCSASGTAPGERGRRLMGNTVPFLPKPFQLDEMVRTVEDALARSVA